MSTINKDKKKLNKRLRHTYRFIIRNDEDLKEVNSFKLSLSKFYLFLVIFLMTFGTLIISLIIFTPIKQFIPGYGDITNNAVFVQLNSDVNELEKLIEEQNTYTNSLKKIIFENDNKSSFSNIKNKAVSNSSGKVSTNKSISAIPILIAPVKGKLSMGYLLKKDHYGIDLVCSKNSEVKSISSGVVVNAVWDPKTGNNISIQHPNNLISIYKHNASLLKKIGEHVTTGEAIAIVGDSGEQSTGPHLHFELWSNGQPVNPELFINFN